ncbi:MAG: class I SAM-dependent methyltransferase [Roseofilum sp. SBFL]|uniref:O-methyltransferase n=1 Tax=unclassified Roseofilum TaxID=2620099 RepID=UPI001B0A78BC|nr:MULTISPECIES: class I SAM-dependent methyltransferase [unclassified Roseofilum]MBP0013107.1 class I SAM-dependent methyltransferase [Roseofilum sp. SID3]MBP0023725.1 class I SAM-dependent methyltransferase [Roseofilum sp. SID2]MBP0036797.1 class I SAM-dependent methyltransferase [Roseofilum sp. SID1]MBP0042587.1 class I SAM-dependent methyltransferase [Roseofilum sp. SBFL]
MSENHPEVQNPRPVTPLGILVEQLEAISKQAKSTNIPTELIDQIERTYQLAAGLNPYIEANTTQESPALATLAHKTSQEPWELRFSDGETVRQLEQEMLSGHLEGQTLKMFVSMTNAKHILEIGMFTGYSALAMAEALPDDGQVIACEIDPYVAEFAQACFKQSADGDKISVKVGPALDIMKELAEVGESFDFVFIDADKGKYIQYLQMLLETSLLAENGWIFVDNTLLQGQPYLKPEQRSANGEAIAQFNRFVTEDPRVEQVLLPLRDGVTMIRRKSKP